MVKAKRYFLLYLIFLIIILLFPFDFRYPAYDVSTNVRWLPESDGSDGIEFLSPSAIISHSPPKRLYDSLVSGDGLTLEIWLAATKKEQHGPARILTYSYNKYLRNFTLGMEGSDLVFRLRTTKSSLNGQPELVVNDVFVTDFPQHIVVSYDFLQGSVYLNGERLLESEVISGGFANWEPNYSLVIGNEATGNRPWLGRIFRVAIYNRPLAYNEVSKNYRAGLPISPSSETLRPAVSDGLVALYLFREQDGESVPDYTDLEPSLDLHAPKEIQVNNKVFLRHPYRNLTLDLKNILEMAVNILLYIPLGYLFHSFTAEQYRSSPSSISIALISGLIFALCIESAQYLIESRSSSMTDVINNMAGLSMGIAIYRLR